MSKIKTVNLPAGWTAEKLLGLKEGLALVKDQGGYWPDEESLRLAHGCYSAWAPELVITRGGPSDREVFLALYEGGAEFFNGAWHIPGGYHRKRETSVQATCSTIAKREIGIDVRFIRALDLYVWQPGEHPYGTPLTIYVEVEPLDTIVETEKLRFFRPDNLPARMSEPHRRFILEKL